MTPKDTSSASSTSSTSSSSSNLSDQNTNMNQNTPESNNSNTISNDEASPITDTDLVVPLPNDELDLLIKMERANKFGSF